MPLTLDPRSKLAKNFREGLDLTDIMPGGIGMAAKMSKPAVDVLSRWIRRFRKDKPPTVPERVIDKAIMHEEVRRGELRFNPQTGERLKYNSPTIEAMEQLNPQRSIRHPLRPDSGSYVTGGQPRNLGITERDDFKKLEDFMLMLRRMPDSWYNKIEKLGE